MIISLLDEECDGGSSSGMEYRVILRRRLGREGAASIQGPAQWTDILVLHFAGDESLEES